MKYDMRLWKADFRCYELGPTVDKAIKQLMALKKRHGPHVRIVWDGLIAKVSRPMTGKERRKEKKRIQKNWDEHVEECKRYGFRPSKSKMKGLV